MLGTCSPCTESHHHSNDQGPLKDARVEPQEHSVSSSHTPQLVRSSQQNSVKYCSGTRSIHLYCKEGREGVTQTSKIQHKIMSHDVAFSNNNQCTYQISRMTRLQQIHQIKQKEGAWEIICVTFAGCVVDSTSWFSCLGRTTPHGLFPSPFFHSQGATKCIPTPNSRLTPLLPSSAGIRWTARWCGAQWTSSSPSTWLNTEHHRQQRQTKQIRTNRGWRRLR